MANIGELPLGTAPKFGLAKKLNLSLCLRPPNNVAKRIFYGGVRTSCKIKRAGRAKFVVFFFNLLGLLPSPSPWPSLLLPGFIDLCKPLGIRTRF